MRARLYRAPIDVGAGDQFKPEFLEISPNNEMPAMVNHDGPDGKPISSTVRPRFVVILPVTHSPPDDEAVGIEIPARVRQALGLDDAPSWVIVSDTVSMNGPTAGARRSPAALACLATDLSLRDID